MLSKKVKARIAASRQRKAEYSKTSRELSGYTDPSIDVVQIGLGVPAFIDELLRDEKIRALGVSEAALKSDGFSTAEIMNRVYGLNA